MAMNAQETAEERWRPILGVEAILISVISMMNDPQLLVAVKQNCTSPELGGCQPNQRLSRGTRRTSVKRINGLEGTIHSANTRRASSFDGEPF